MHFQKLNSTLQHSCRSLLSPENIFKSIDGKGLKELLKEGGGGCADKVEMEQINGGTIMNYFLVRGGVRRER